LLRICYRNVGRKTPAAIDGDDDREFEIDPTKGMLARIAANAAPWPIPGVRIS
jgi:hypothetical protein